MHLANGDYLLIGPIILKTYTSAASATMNSGFSAKNAGRNPIKLNHKLNEGAAVSKTQ
jgi:hypothetical protein